MLRQSLIGSLLEVARRTCARAATTSRSSRSARATARRTDRPTHEWWRLGFALTGAAEPPSWNRAARAVRPRRREGRHRAALPPTGLPGARAIAPLSDDPNLHPGRARPRQRRRPASRADVGELHPRSSRRSISARADRRRRDRDRGPVRRRSVRSTRGRAVAPSRRSSATSRSSSRWRCPRATVADGHPAARRAAAALPPLFDIYPAGRSPTTEEPRLPADAPGRRPDLTDAEIDARSRRSWPASRPTRSPPPHLTGPHRSATHDTGGHGTGGCLAAPRWPLLPLRRARHRRDALTDGGECVDIGEILAGSR